MEGGGWIIHLDLDAFYASAEALDNPALKGLPVIVGGLGPRSVVSTCSYEARAKKVRSGIPMSRARTLCPEGIFLGVRMGRYQELSAKVMAIFRRYTPLVEPLSLDEAFLDVTGSLALFGPAVLIAQKIRREVFEETGLTVSAGVASTKHVAKIASGRHKPDSITVIPPGSEKEFLRTLDIGDLWGVGKVRAQSLRQMGLNLVGELADLNPAVLVRRFGESGLKLWELSNGLDNRAVEPDRPAKSLGAEETYPEDIDGEERISREILSLCVRVAERLRKQGLAAATVVLKVRDGDFRTFTRSKSVKTPFKGDYLALHKAAMELFPAGKSGPWRLLGVTATNLSSRLEETADLLASQREEKASQGGEKASLLEAMDKINSRPGGPGIGPAALIGERDKE